MAVCALVAGLEMTSGTGIHKESRKQGSQEIASQGRKLRFSFSWIPCFLASLENVSAKG